MDFGDLGDRLKKAKGKQQGITGEEKPFNAEEARLLRGKMLGVLLQDARLKSARTVEECSRLLGIAPETIVAWEYGDDSPDLPQLELLAYYLEVPVSHFWSDTTISSGRNPSEVQSEYHQLRQSMIGALLRQARESQSMSLNDLATGAQLDVDTISAYEVGALPIPLPHLQMLAHLVDKNLDYFLESASYIGELLRIREEWKHFMALDEETRRFAANPLNIGFIKIAVMFSQMPAEQLRQIAAGLLDISM